MLPPKYATINHSISLLQTHNNHNIMLQKTGLQNVTQGSYKCYVGSPAGSHLSKLVATPCNCTLHGQTRSPQTPIFFKEKWLKQINVCTIYHIAISGFTWHTYLSDPYIWQNKISTNINLFNNDSKLKLTLERFAWNDATFRSVTTDLGHACLWLDPDKF